MRVSMRNSRRFPISYFTEMACIFHATGALTLAHGNTPGKKAKQTINKIRRSGGRKRIHGSCGLAGGG